MCFALGEGGAEERSAGRSEVVCLSLVLLDSLFPVLVGQWVCVGVGSVILAAALLSSALLSLLLITVNKHRASIGQNNF